MPGEQTQRPKARALGGLVLLFGCSACTTLGPIPAMTGVPVTPAGRTSTELQVAATPGYYLSSSVTPEPKASTLPQLIGLIEPDAIIHVPGLFAGARYAGDSDAGASLEPLLGYRTHLDARQRFALAAVGFFTYASEARNQASFSAWRGGLEAAGDVRLTPTSKYCEVHTHLGLTMTGLSAAGSYCVDGDGYGVDCDDGIAMQPRVAGSVGGFFPSAQLGLSLDFGRRLQSAFHGIRVAADGAGGLMPRLIDGEQRGLEPYGSIGLSLSVGIGASD
jgi:hypothetical protein